MVNGLGKKITALITSIIIGLVKGIMIVPRGTCRFYPSCTEYANEAFRTMPFFIAIFKTAYRLMRCNPFSKGGFDPVNKRKVY
jgi:putative membrane protein insertion efficiency factor